MGLVSVGLVSMVLGLLLGLGNGQLARGATGATTGSSPVAAAAALSPPAPASELQPPTGASVPAGTTPRRLDARQASLGAFLTDLGDLSPTSGSFAARFWLWSVEAQANRNILQTVEFPQALKVEAGAIISTTTPEGRWLQRPIQGVFRHHWDLRNFPFDRQKLHIKMEETELESSELFYAVDSSSSRIDPQITLPGWRIVSTNLVAGTHSYPTRFGDPAASQAHDSAYARAELLILLERTDRTGFLKLTAGAFMAAAMALASYGLKLDNPTALSPRLGLLAGCLFTTVISLRTASADLGAMASTTLVDKIHIAVLVYILVATVAALAQWRLTQQGASTTKLQRRNLQLAGLSSLGFGITVLLLLLSAMAPTPLP